MPSVATLFFGFFAASMLVLFLILCANIPRVWSTTKHYFRLHLARRTRKARMLADPQKLESDSRRLQGMWILAENSASDNALPMDSIGSR